MARPLEEYRVKINGSSLQVLRQGVYIGSIGLKDLCQLVGTKRRNGTVPELAQVHFINEDREIGVDGTIPEIPAKDHSM